jgi:hypothetical protein
LFVEYESYIPLWIEIYINSSTPITFAFTAPKEEDRTITPRSHCINYYNHPPRGWRIQCELPSITGMPFSGRYNRRSGRKHQRGNSVLLRELGKGYVSTSGGAGMEVMEVTV